MKVESVPTPSIDDRVLTVEKSLDGATGKGQTTGFNGSVSIKEFEENTIERNKILANKADLNLEDLTKIIKHRSINDMIAPMGKRMAAPYPIKKLEDKFRTPLNTV